MPEIDDKTIELLHNEALMGFRAQSMGRDQNEVINKMRALAPELVQRYLSTNYITNVQGDEVVLRIGELPPSALNLMSEARAIKSWSIITAYNPYSVDLSEEENIARQAMLANTLANHGYESQPAHGQGEDASWTEPSILVFGISYEMAMNIGTCFQQNAIVFGQADHQIELVFCDRESKLKEPESVRPPAEPSSGSRPVLGRRIGRNWDLPDAEIAQGMSEQSGMTGVSESPITPSSPYQEQTQPSGEEVSQEAGQSATGKPQVLPDGRTMVSRVRTRIRTEPDSEEDRYSSIATKKCSICDNKAKNTHFIEWSDDQYLKFEFKCIETDQSVSMDICPVCLHWAELRPYCNSESSTAEKPIGVGDRRRGGLTLEHITRLMRYRSEYVPEDCDRGKQRDML